MMMEKKNFSCAKILFLWVKKTLSKTYPIYSLQVTVFSRLFTEKIQNEIQKFNLGWLHVEHA